MNKSLVDSYFREIFFRKYEITMNKGKKGKNLLTTLIIKFHKFNSIEETYFFMIQNL